MPPPPPLPRPHRVAVIGAGAAGLVAARELLRHGHEVVVFEKSHRVGGTWVYNPNVESDPIGLDPRREIVHGSMYRSLRTNLPRPLMGFLDYPFPDPTRSNGDPRAFPSHGEVLAFLEGYCREFGIEESIRFGSEVVRVETSGTGSERGHDWVLESRQTAASAVVERFEAVVVCNGHHTQPRIAEIQGIDRWPGKQIHSHNYRTPDPFQDKVVVIIGNGTSAHDISREISNVAKEVHLASRSSNIEVGKLDGYNNIWQHQMILCLYEDGKMTFQDNKSLYPDFIVHCTGYKYHFPFLNTNGLVTVKDNCVGPLYQHIFPPLLSPWLSFIGIVNKVIPFLTIELQCKWVANVLSGKQVLPPKEEMMASVEELYYSMGSMERPKHHTHSIHPNEIDYMNWLAAQTSLPPLEEWRVEMYLDVYNSILSHDDCFRETWHEKCWRQ